ncbi:MAG: non-canonical purine NTP pyrophosphatase [Longimicrobiales bacterium]|nr:non-canonical purine NTP pyrophosphatase [Longimicrobiales bacterium]
MKLLIATRSAGKLREIRRILSEVDGLEVLGLDDVGIAYDPEEDGLEPYHSFEENALSKARYFHQESGLPTVADDSGIEVDALGGAPGVRSKRFAPDAGVDGDGLEGQALDDANNRHLVRSLQGVAPGERTARYVCVAVLLEEGRPPLTIRGEAPGVVVDEPSGSGGFGYDPHVFDPTLGKTFAEMTPEEKDARSHRGHAFRALAAELQRRLQESPDSAGGKA